MRCLKFQSPNWIYVRYITCMLQYVCATVHVHNVQQIGAETARETNHYA